MFAYTESHPNQAILFIHYCASQTPAHHIDLDCYRITAEANGGMTGHTGSCHKIALCL